MYRIDKMKEVHHRLFNFCNLPIMQFLNMESLTNFILNLLITWMRHYFIFDYITTVFMMMNIPALFLTDGIMIFEFGIPLKYVISTCGFIKCSAFFVNSTFWRILVKSMEETSTSCRLYFSHISALLNSLN